MFTKTRRNVAVLAGAAGLNLLVGAAVASGVVPQGGDSVTIASERPPVTEPAEVLAAAFADPAPAVVETTLPPTTLPPVTTPPTTRAPRAAASTSTQAGTAATTAAPTTAAPAPTTPPVTLPARTNPSSGQVTQAITALSPSPLFKPTEAQARQFGDTVCTAFDQGKTFAEVAAGALAAAQQVPLVGALVTAADINNAVRTAVQLFCPGHTTKL